MALMSLPRHTDVPPAQIGIDKQPPRDPHSESNKHEMGTQEEKTLPTPTSPIRKTDETATAGEEPGSIFGVPRV